MTVTTVFELGPNWDQIRCVQLALTATKAVASIKAYTSDDGATCAQPMMLGRSDGPVTSSLVGAGSLLLTGWQSGRFVRVVWVNGGTAQGAGASIRMTAYPDC